jgi:DNA-binding NarL/FixJ family response regulator
MEATERALKLHPDLKIIVLTMFGDEEYLYSMVLKGIQGYLLKTTSLTTLERAIKMVSSGQQYYSPELNGLLAKKLRQFSSNELPSFTKKETELLKLLCKGFSTEEIAEKLCMSKRTVEGYRAKLLHKTGLSNTINLVIYAIRNKLVTLEELEPVK